jgi:hypothetical protein
VGAARLDANFGIKGDTSNYIILACLLDLKFLSKPAAIKEELQIRHARRIPWDNPVLAAPGVTSGGFFIVRTWLRLPHSA